ncbi:MAG: Crp/Fnr family transcriptional regulator [Treponema sp.]|nr:Crp/Fnr family transcriptional regulator [Treponema sp.]
MDEKTNENKTEPTKSNSESANSKNTNSNPPDLNSTSEEILRRMPFWEKLSGSEKSEFIRKSTRAKYIKGRMITDSERECLGLLFVIRGKIRVYMLSEEGKEMTLFKIGSGESCVMSASCAIEQITFETQLVAEEDTELLVIRTSDFARISEENVHVRCFMFETLTKRFSLVMEAMQNLYFEKIDTRVMSYLKRECERTNSSEIFATQEEIAVSINSAREVVARTLKRFERNGQIEMKRGVIKLKVESGKVRTEK